MGTPLGWEEAKKNAQHVREWGIQVRIQEREKAGCTKTYIDSGLIQQLLAIWNRAKGKERDALLWGDEVRLAKYPLGSVAET